MSNRIVLARIATALLSSLVLLLTACGGSDGAGQAANPMVGPGGGTVSGPNGAQVVIPAGALSTNTPVAVAQSSAGAPAMPPGFAAFGATYAFTPHGTNFALPVTVTVPFDPALVPVGSIPVIYKTNGQGAWEAVPGANVIGATVIAQVTGFSFFLVGNLPPQITQQPAGVSVVEGQTATFSVTALGTPPFSFQWQRSDDGGMAFNDVGGATAATLMTAATTVMNDNGDRYRVIVGNLEGATTSAAATLTVTSNIVAPALTQQPQDVTVAVDADATFTVVATGTNVQYQWEQSIDSAVTFTTLTGETNAGYTLRRAQAGDNGKRFRALVSNSAGSVTSNTARLTVGSTPPPVAGARAAAGNAFSLARNASGSAVFSWGSDSGEALGNGAGGDRDLPGSIPLPGFVAQPATAIATGGGSRHGLMISDGAVWGWGYNGFGQLGTNNTNSQPNPLPMTHDNGFVVTGATAIAAGTLHSLVLRNDGRVFAVGFNASGQLGDGTTTNRLRAVAVPGLANITAIAAGGHFSLALRNDGTVWSWGANTSGQLGVGTFAGRSTPVQVNGVAGAVAIAAGDLHALALLGNGAVVAWGGNSEGQLGDNTTVSRSTPVAVLGFSRAFSIAAGGNNSMAFGEVLMIWGSNQFGQLGTGSTVPALRTVAAPIPAFASGGVFEFAVGGTHVIAARNDGTVWAWGANDSGQIGNGASGGNVLAPVQIQGLNLN